MFPTPRVRVEAIPMVNILATNGLRAHHPRLYTYPQHVFESTCFTVGDGDHVPIPARLGSVAQQTFRSLDLVQMVTP